MIQKNNSVPSAETNDDSSNVADVTTSSPNNAKPLVSRRFFVKSEYCGTYVNKLPVTELQANKLRDRLTIEAREQRLPHITYTVVENGG